MSGFVLIVLWMMILMLAFPSMPVTHNENNKFCIKWNWALVAILPMILLIGFRENVGDTGSYTHFFWGLPDNFKELLELLPTEKKDKGFTLLSGIIKIVFGSNETVFLLILAFVQGFCLVKIYRRYAESFIWSIFLFIISADYISWMCNGIRQFTAVTIIFAGTNLILQKRYFRMVLLILLAATIHGSALLMRPIIFIVQGKAMNKKTILVIFFSLLILMFVGQFTDLLDVLLSDTQYTNVVSDWKSWDDNGTNPLRVALFAIPSILAIIGLKHIRYADDKMINLCVNMSIVSTGIYIISSREV